MSKKSLIAGVDEVGRGCLAGPVVSAAVILKKGVEIKDIRDSKKISFNERIRISELIKKNSYYSIGIATVDEIYELNILKAALLSMERAIFKLKVKPERVLIDGKQAPSNIKNFKTIINGDEKIKCISAASIVAKVYRDRLMIKLSKLFNKYSWERNFGYGTKGHFEGLKKYGVSIHHRKGFRPIHNRLFKKKH